MHTMPFATCHLPKSGASVLHSRRTQAARPRCSAASMARGSGLPNAADDLLVSRTSFVKAYLEAQQTVERIDGLQEFAAAVWERRRRIPTVNYNDPLKTLFDEFDKDGDGHLTAVEIASALQSRGVSMTKEIAQKYIDAADLDGNHEVEFNEFEDLIFRMARADLTGQMPASKESKGPLKRGKSLLEMPVFQMIIEKDPSLLRIPGLQEFAASVWDRQRRVPIALWHDPLEASFKEFDADGDGHLTVSELVAALTSNGVEITYEQAEVIVQAVDSDGNGTIEFEEFPSLIYNLALLDKVVQAVQEV